MLYKQITLLAFIIVVLLFPSCTTTEKYNFSPRANYDALWKILDEGYCYFDEKLPQDSTWQMMYQKHLPKIREGMSQIELFDALNELMFELKDGHVSLYSSFDRKAYNKWRSNYPSQLDYDIRLRYLGDKYRVAGSLIYAPIVAKKSIGKSKVGFVYYGSFMNGISHAHINAVLRSFIDCKGLIIDIRNNGGGEVVNAMTLASHFLFEKTLVCFMSYKNGPRHNDFDTPRPLYLEPTDRGILWKRPVVILTNRGVYSAANEFALYMKQCPYAILLGDTTGGGGGLPRGSELPNGWRLRYSGSKTTDPEGRQVEFGIEPHKKVSLLRKDIDKGEDTLIEAAIDTILRFKEKNF